MTADTACESFDACWEWPAIHVVDDEVAVIHRGGDEAWMTWARRHGIDPSDVPLHTVLRRDVTGRRVHFARFCRDEDGQVRVDPTWNALWVNTYVQLEAAPLPWPVTP